MSICSLRAPNSHWGNSCKGCYNLTANISILDIARPDTCLKGATKRSYAGYSAAISPSSLLALRETKDYLQKPELVSSRCRKEVITVSAEDSLASILAIAFERDFPSFQCFHVIG